jgi:hypothetical protein
MLIKKINIFHAKIIISLFLYSTLLLGFFFNEDSLGGAIHDYNYHLPIVLAFKKNISESLLIYGSNEMIARNSPFFYIILGSICKFVENINIIRLANVHVILIIIIYFYKSLKNQFKTIIFNYI